MTKVTVQNNITITENNVTTPKEHGAVGGAESGKGASYDPATKTLTIEGRTATSDDIGKLVGYGGQETFVEDVVNGNIVTEDVLSSNNKFWYLGALNSFGEDATSGINAAYQAMDENGGGIVDLDNDTYLISLSETDYNAGRKSAIILDKTPGIPLAIIGGKYGTQRNAKLIFRWSSFGDAIGSTDDTIIDYVTLSDFHLTGVAFAKVSGVKRQSGIRIKNPKSGFPDTDSHIRMRNLWIANMGKHGIDYSGRGEVHIEHCNIGTVGEYGIFLHDTFDNKLINNTIAATGKTGLRVEKAGSTNITGGKIFYIGDKGADDEADSAAIAIVGTQWRNGNLHIANVNVQEIRGSGVYIEDCGRIALTNINLQGIGRQLGNQTTLPPIIADLRFKGGDCLGIHVNGVHSSGFPLYEDQLVDDGDNWKYHGSKTHFVYIDGATTGLGTDGIERTYGPEDIFGEFHYMEQYTRQNYDLDFGTKLSNTTHGNDVIIAGGGGESNGRNTGLRINGVPLN